MRLNTKTLHCATDFATFGVARAFGTDQHARAVRLLQCVNEVRQKGYCSPTIAHIVVDCARKQARIRLESFRGLDDFPTSY